MTYHSIFRPNLFQDQTIIVTGGGSGIGRAAAHELASLGAHVVIASRRTTKLARIRDEIVAEGGSASFARLNLREEESIEALFAQVMAERGAVHGLVNNAGGQYLSPAEQITSKGFDAVVSVNLRGTFLMCQQAYNRWMAKHGGVIVNMLMENWRGFPGMAHSAAARAGVDNLTKTLAVEWAHSGVRVNAVAPGIIASSGLAHYGEGARPLFEQAVRDIPAKRMGTESEVAAVITFLLSPAAAYISGETIKIDGASSLWRKTWEIEEHENWPERFDGWPDT